MAFDLTTWPVEIAVVPIGTDPTTTDYVAAQWTRAAPQEQKKPLYHLSTAYRFAKITATIVDLDTDTSESDSASIAAKLGPDGIIAPPIGTNDVWGHVGNSATSENLYFLLGQLKVT